MNAARSDIVHKSRSLTDIKNRNFGALVHELRVRRGMTQVELADRIGTTPNTIYNIESGRSCSMPNMMAIMEILDIQVEFHVGAIPQESSPHNQLLDTALRTPPSLAGYLSSLLVAAQKLRTTKKRDLLLAFTESLPMFGEE